MSSKQGTSALMSEISLPACRGILQRYPKYVPQGLEELDTFRFEQLPRTVAERRPDRNTASDSDAAGEIMSKDELIQLVTWKLKHGTFRPKLLQLVESNDEEAIEEALEKAIMADESTTPKQRLETLTKLKGIGPATASLVLSVVEPKVFPFFSDELFRWAHWQGRNSKGTAQGIKPGKGWARPIGYTINEYLSLFQLGTEALQRLRSSDHEDALVDFTFLDLEKVAYVLGKEKTDVDGDTFDASSSKRDTDAKTDSEKEANADDGEEDRFTTKKRSHSSLVDDDEGTSRAINSAQRRSKRR